MDMAESESGTTAWSVPGKLDAARLAYIDLFLAQAEMRAFADVEAQVAHWVIEGLASHEDLIAARAAAADAKKVHQACKRKYTRTLGMRAKASPGRGARYGRRVTHTAPLVMTYGA
jgi:hypothetical protein